MPIPTQVVIRMVIELLGLVERIRHTAYAEGVSTEDIRKVFANADKAEGKWDDAEVDDRT